MRINGFDDKFIIEYNEEEIGFAVLSKTKPPYIINVRIDPKFQKIGIGTLLYDYIEMVIGKNLQSSPDKMSPSAKSFWIKRQK